MRFGRSIFWWKHRASDHLNFKCIHHTVDHYIKCLLQLLAIKLSTKELKNVKTNENPCTNANDGRCNSWIFSSVSAIPSHFELDHNTTFGRWIVEKLNSHLKRMFDTREQKEAEDERNEKKNYGRHCIARSIFKMVKPKSN